MNKNKTQRLLEPNVRPYILVLLLFTLATLFLQIEYRYYIAGAEALATLCMLLYSLVVGRKKRNALKAYVDSVTYDTEVAQNSTLLNFPLPIVVFRLEDSRIVWGNDLFFSICGVGGERSDKNVAELVPAFSGKWLVEGKTLCPEQLTVGGRVYQIHGSIVRTDHEGDEAQMLMGITYWVDVTDHSQMIREYGLSRPVAAIFIIDNFDDLMKNQSERTRNDLRNGVGEKLEEWCKGKNGVLRRFDRDRYLFVFEERCVREILDGKFSILETVHEVVNSSGIHATLSIGMGRAATDVSEALQFAELAADMALARGGDQAVVRNRSDFEFYGGKTAEGDYRTKVRSRVSAETFGKLVKDSSRVLVMGHRYSDMDCVGAAAAVCAIARNAGVPVNIVTDRERAAAKPLISLLEAAPQYAQTFITPQDAMLIADSKTLMVVVDTNLPEQVEDRNLLQSCNRVAVIDHHRKSKTGIENALFSCIETGVSSTSELMTEFVEINLNVGELLPIEATAMLSGIVLDTKGFTMRTKDLTFDAAAALRRAGADTVQVRTLMQSDVESSIAKFKILEQATLYRGVAIAAPETQQDRVVAAQAADSLLDIAGVDASMVIYPLDKDGREIFISARSMGRVNVQLIMEKLGGGGNIISAAAQLKNTGMKESLTRLKKAIDEYMDA